MVKNGLIAMAVMIAAVAVSGGLIISQKISCRQQFQIKRKEAAGRTKRI